MMYMSRFFSTRNEAETLVKEQGYGAIYSNVKGSRTQKSYRVEAAMAYLNDETKEQNPYVVAWNEKR